MRFDTVQVRDVMKMGRMFGVVFIVKQTINV
jgi:hypothetical protein